MSTIDNIEFKIARLDLRPGDVLVVKVNDHIPDETASRIKSYVRGAIDDSIKVLVIDRSVDISILTAAEIEARIAAPQSEEDAA